VVDSSSKQPLPFLKWAGGKRKLAGIIIEAFPDNFDPKVNKFYEPFVGGGALTFALGNKSADLYVPGKQVQISDMNPDLINTYKVLRDDVEALISELKKFKKMNDPESFYKIRAANYENQVKRAARFIYLNKTCFNGLWRVNSRGEFNVPFGSYKNPNILDRENLMSCHKRLHGAKISLCSFQEISLKPAKGDLVYFDPPYIPISKTAAFSQYAKEDFGLPDQEELNKTIRGLTKRGVRVILSNSDTRLTRDIFGASLTLRQISVARTISAKASTRKAVQEVIGTNYIIPNDSVLSNHRVVH
jgi:DNA adenine methylase